MNCNLKYFNGLEQNSFSWTEEINNRIFTFGLSAHARVLTTEAEIIHSYAENETKYFFSIKNCLFNKRINIGHKRNINNNLNYL